jgi:hypothetical protein
MVTRTLRFRVRRQIDAGCVTFRIEGALDEFAARLLAYTVALVPRATTAIVDLSAAAPIRGPALVVFARIFAAGRQVRLRGLGKGHEGLRALCPVLPQPALDRLRDHESVRFAQRRAAAA